MYTKGVTLPQLIEVGLEVGVRPVRLRVEDTGELSFALIAVEEEFKIRLYGKPEPCRHAYQRFVRTLLERHPEATCELQMSGPITPDNVDEVLEESDKRYLLHFAGKFTVCAHDMAELAGTVGG